MTKTYAITEEQRAKVIEALSHPHGFRAEARGIMQSLPLITGEPVAWRRFDAIDVAWRVELTTNDDYDGWEPLYTSPQALTPITAADITDEMVEYIATHLRVKREIMALSINSWIKHRSEAK